MIVQTAPESRARFAIKMDEHTGLSVRFAEAFGNDRFERVEPREQMLYMIGNHDKGWRDFDADPRMDPTTRLPYNLVETPAEDITRTSSGSPDFNERHHPYCGLLSSMHSWGLYNGRYGLSNQVLIDTFAEKDRPLADRMLEGELQRQARLKQDLSRGPETAAWVEESSLFQNYKQVQFFDTLALYFNRTHEGGRDEVTFEHVPINAEEDVSITIRPVERGVYSLSPYPLAEEPFEVSFSGRYIEPLPEGEAEDWGERLRRAPTERQTVKLVRG